MDLHEFGSIEELFQILWYVWQGCHQFKNQLRIKGLFQLEGASIEELFQISNDVRKRDNEALSETCLIKTNS